MPKCKKGSKQGLESVLTLSYPRQHDFFNKARARARKIHWQRKRESWIKYVTSHVQQEVKRFGKKSVSSVENTVLAQSPCLFSNGVYVNIIPDIVNTLAETFAKMSSCDNYTPANQELKL
ncbi:hypothetical protein TNCV_3693741 [Trichonephila clavipes]|nr:hypothetical protein TNCV_3693741 [Trichonephila clavipes]